MHPRTLPVLCFTILAVGLLWISGCGKAKELASDAQKKLADGADTVGKELKKGASEVNKGIQKGVKDLKGGVDDLKQDAEQLADRAKTAVGEQLNLAGSMTLQLGKPLERQGCYAQLTQLSGGRQSVLQLRSYEEAGKESFPSVYLHAHVDASDMQSLIGQPLTARLFVQEKQDGPIWYSAEGENIQWTIASIEDGTVNAKVSPSTLLNTDTGQGIEVTGQFTAVTDW